MSPVEAASAPSSRLGWWIGWGVVVALVVGGVVLALRHGPAAPTAIDVRR